MTTTLPLSSILVVDRLRKAYGDIDLLSEDIVLKGLIQPLVLNLDAEGRHVLVAGGRRYAALQLAGYVEVMHGVTCDPKRPGFVYASELPPHLQREIELSENFNRKDMTWQEEVAGAVELHGLWKAAAALDSVKWTRAMTGNRLGGYSDAYIDQCFDLVNDLAKPAFAECQTLTDAVKVKARIREDAALAEQLRRTRAEIASVPIAVLTVPMQCVACEGTGKNSKGDTCTICQGNGRVEHYEKNPVLIDPTTTIVDISHTLFNGDCLDVLSSFPPACIDHIITDPPYAIDVDNIDQAGKGIHGISRVKDTHQVDANLSLFAAMLPLFYKVLKPTGFCCLWCDTMMWQTLYDLGIKSGFKVQRWPHVWCKTSQCENNMAFVNETKATELVIIMRKDEAKLAQTVAKNFTIAEGLKVKQSNPFEKPGSVWFPLIDMVSTPGQLILDPFAGSGSGPMSCLSMERRIIAIEKETSHYSYMVESFKQWNKLQHGKCQFT